jgi:general secretion pathway protein D
MKLRFLIPFLILTLLLPQTRAQQIAVPDRPLVQTPIAAPASSQLSGAAAPTVPSQSSSSSPEQTVSIQFPHTSINEVLMTYEKLTGKRLIRDSNLAGPELSIVVANEIPKSEAIALIESSLLLNGYTLIPVDEKTSKILGPSRPPRSEGLPLYLEESQLPQDGDKVVSFYKTLQFLSPDEATTIIQGVVQMNAFGSIVSIPNTSALVITEKTPIIRKAIAILDVVDKEPSQIITEFIPLQRANADKVVETLDTMFGGGSGGTSHPSTPGGAPQGNQGASVTSGGDMHLLSGKPQFIADKRTNRVLIIVKAENYKYLRELIAKLDQPDDFAKPLVRPLNFLSVNDVYPVLTDMLKDKDDTANGAAGATAGSTPAPTPRQSQSQNNVSSTSTSSSGGTDTSDKLQDPEHSSPQSVTIGNTSIIADPNANSIIVYGPSDTQRKAAQIIDLLDQRPKQVYLAAVIGELQLTEGMDYGANWFAKLSSAGGGGGSNNLIGAAVNGTVSGFLTNLVTSSVNNAVSSFPSSLAGLTVFGAVAQGVSTYAHFLESTGKFRTISRPVVYTSNNKRATILSGQLIPVPGQSSYNTVGAVGTNSLNNVTSTINYQQVALKLEIIPLINSDKEVNLQIVQVNNTLGTAVNIGGNSVNQVNTQELTTTVRIPNGSTIVLGGLISDDKQSDDAGIPYINRIPILGPLLGGTTKKSRNRNELVIMIQPIVVDSNGAMEKASAEEGAESELGKRAQTIKDRLEPTPTPTPKKKWFQLFQPRKIDNF